MNRPEKLSIKNISLLSVYIIFFSNQLHVIANYRNTNNAIIIITGIFQFQIPLYRREHA